MPRWTAAAYSPSKVLGLLAMANWSETEELEDLQKPTCVEHLAEAVERKMELATGPIDVFCCIDDCYLEVEVEVGTGREEQSDSSSFD